MSRPDTSTSASTRLPTAAGPSSSLNSGEESWSAPEPQTFGSSCSNGMSAMAADGVDDMVLRAIGGDAAATAWIEARAETSSQVVLLVVAALLARAPERLERARSISTTSRDRQLVEIAHVHLRGEQEQVDALARDHLVDHPDNLLVAWIASGAAAPVRRPSEP
jgi:hypothetical protein